MKAWLKSILIRHPTVQRLQHRLRQHRTISELREVAEIFRNNRCVWSLQSGNTLGIYRDGGFLPNENDVDIAVLAEDWHRGIDSRAPCPGLCKERRHELHGRSTDGVEPDPGSRRPGDSGRR